MTGKEIASGKATCPRLAHLYLAQPRFKLRNPMLLRSKIDQRFSPDSIANVCKGQGEKKYFGQLVNSNIILILILSATQLIRQHKL